MYWITTARKLVKVSYVTSVPSTWLQAVEYVGILETRLTDYELCLHLFEEGIKKLERNVCEQWEVL